MACARLADDGHRHLALHGVPPRPLLGGDRRGVPGSRSSARSCSASLIHGFQMPEKIDTNVITALEAIPGTLLGLGALLDDRRAPGAHAPRAVAPCASPAGTVRRAAALAVPQDHHRRGHRRLGRADRRGAGGHGAGRGARRWATTSSARTRADRGPWQVLYRGGFYRGGPILRPPSPASSRRSGTSRASALGVPVYELLGGASRDQMRVYGWIGGDRPADVATGAQAGARGGFDAVKMNATDEMHCIDSDGAHRGGRRAPGGGARAVGLDVGDRLPRPRAQGDGASVLVKELEPYGPMFIEEPVLPRTTRPCAKSRATRPSRSPRASGCSRAGTSSDCSPPASSTSSSPTSRTPAASGVPQDRRDGRGVRRGGGAALPARADHAGRLAAARLLHAERLHPGAEPGHPLQPGRRAARLPEDAPSSTSGRLRRRPTAPGWASRSTRRRCGTGRDAHRWRNPSGAMQTGASRNGEDPGGDHDALRDGRRDRPRRLRGAPAVARGERARRRLRGRHDRGGRAARGRRDRGAHAARRRRPRARCG